MKVRVVNIFSAKRLRPDMPGKIVHHVGDTFDLDDHRARILIRQNLAVADESENGESSENPKFHDSERPLAQVEAARGGNADPSPPPAPPQTGGPTGEASPASSSRRGRRRQRPE